MKQRWGELARLWHRLPAGEALRLEAAATRVGGAQGGGDFAQSWR
jgi:hypothetical protein